MSSWIIALAGPSIIAIVSGLLLKFLPVKTWGKMFSAFLRLRFGKDTEDKVESLVLELEKEFNEGMKEDATN
jgi:hypothetical protein